MAVAAAVAPSVVLALSESEALSVGPAAVASAHVAVHVLRCLS